MHVSVDTKISAPFQLKFIPPKSHEGDKAMVVIRDLSTFVSCVFFMSDDELEELHKAIILYLASKEIEEKGA